MPKLTETERDMYDEFMLTFERCWACGWKPGVSDLRDWMRPELHNSHIYGGPNRTHSRRNICRLCEGCHRLSHTHIVRDHDNRVLPFLTRANLLWLKKYRDSEYYDRIYLRALTMRRYIPTIARPHDWFVNEYGRQCPIWLPNHTYKSPPP